MYTSVAGQEKKELFDNALHTVYNELKIMARRKIFCTRWWFLKIGCWNWKKKQVIMKY